MSDNLQGGVNAGASSISLTFLLRSSTNSTEVTGKVAADLTLAYIRQGGSLTTVTASDLAAIGSTFSSGGVKEIGSGAYRVDWPNLAFASGADWVQFIVTCSGCFAFHERVPITSNVIQTGDAFGRLGAPAGASIATDVAAVKADTASTLTDAGAIKAKTDNIPAAPADETLIIAATNALSAKLGTPAGASVSADIAAVKSDTSSVLTDAAEILAKTNNLPSNPAATTDIPSAASVATAVMGSTVEGSITLLGAIRLKLSALVGKASGMATTSVAFRDTGDTKNRITATVDTNGDRTSVTLDAS